MKKDLDKIYFVLLVVLFFIVLLIGCKLESSDYKGHTRYFKTISKEAKGMVIYDTRTGVEYWRPYGSYSGTITVLVDADGKPLIYEAKESEVHNGN